jgi:hypothetical protein
VALTPSEHRSDKNHIDPAKELKQTVEETLFANRKSKEKMLQAINQIPL